MEVVVYLFNLYLLLLPLPSYVYLRDVYLRDVYLRDVYLRESYYSISTDDILDGGGQQQQPKTGSSEFRNSNPE